MRIDTDRKNYNKFTKKQLVQEANSLRIGLENFLGNCHANNQQIGLVEMWNDSGLAIARFETHDGRKPSIYNDSKLKNKT